MIPSVQKYSQESDFRDLPSWLWLWLPLAYLALHVIISGISGPLYERVLGGGELGTNELLTMGLLLIAVFVGLHTLFIMRGLGDSRLWVWIFLGTLGCIYFGGEEASWGQHLIGWESSEAWQEFNDQQETNLHNSEKYGPLLDQLPRNLLTIGILIGGIIAPLWRRRRDMHLNPAGINYWIWPTMVCLPVGICAVFITVPESIYEAITGIKHPARFDITGGELKEFFIANFLMLYMLSFNLRMRQLKSGMSETQN